MRKPSDKRLYWRGGKLWCRVPGPDGHITRKATRCINEAAASARADEFERRFADPHHAAAAAATLEGSVKAYFADLDRRGRSAATKEIAAQKCGHFVRLWGHDLSMSDFEARAPQMVVAYIDQRKGEGASPFTVKKELGQLSQVLTIARYLGTFRRPLEEVFPPYLSGEHKPRTRKPSFDEVRRLLAQFGDRRAAHLAFFVATGARLGEAQRARREDVDLAAGVVRLRGTKRPTADAQVPITRLARPLVEWLLERAPGRHLLFAPWGKLHRDVAAACVRAGIERVTPNDLRRSFASWHREAIAASGGADKTAAELVSKLLRHTTDKLAQTTYAKLEAPEVGRAVDARLGGVSGLYLGDASTASTGALLHEESQGECAPPAEFESAPNGLGIRRQSLPHERRSAGTIAGIRRSRERAAQGAVVPGTYRMPRDPGDVRRFMAEIGELETTALVGAVPRLAGRVARPAWLYEAVANMYELLAEVR